MGIAEKHDRLDDRDASGTLSDLAWLMEETLKGADLDVLLRDSNLPSKPDPAEFIQLTRDGDAAGMIALNGTLKNTLNNLAVLVASLQDTKARLLGL